MRLNFITIVVLAGISYASAADGWVPFSSQVQSPISYQDLRLEKSSTATEFKVNLNFPGATLDYPDDNGLLGGKYAVLSLIPPVNNIIDVVHMNAAVEVEKAGKPDLPFIRLQVRIPSWVNFDDVKVAFVNTQYQAITGQFAIAPVQERIPDSYEAGDIDPRIFLVNNKIYSTDAIFEYPIEYQKNIMHGIKFLEIYYAPFKYNPVTKQVFSTQSAQLVVSFTGQPQPEENTSALFESIVNGRMFDAITGVVDQRTAPSRGGSFFVVTGTKMGSSAVLKQFIDYRVAQGYKLVELFQSDATAAITTKLKDTYKANKFDYLIIVGDETILKPPTAGTGSGSFSYKDWAKLDGTDDIEDVMSGIFLCGDDATLSNVLYHQKQQEQGGPWNKTILTTAGAVKAPNWPAYCTAHYGTVHLDDPSLNFKFTINRVFVGANPTSYGAWVGIPQTNIESWVKNAFFTNSTQAVDAVKKFWNEGASVVGHRDHGSSSGPSSPSMNGSFVSGITSESSPFFMSINCLSGSFIGNHANNFTYQTQVRKAGTCATLSASVTTQTDVNCKFMLAMWQTMVPKTGEFVRNIGVIYQAGMLKCNTSNRKYYHLFGDPMTNLTVGLNNNTQISGHTGNKLADVYNVKYSGSKLVFQTNASGIVRIDLYSLQGKLVKTAVNETMDAGSHALSLTDNNQMLASGMYFTRIKTPALTKTITVLLK